MNSFYPRPSQQSKRSITSAKSTSQFGVRSSKVNTTTKVNKQLSVSHLNQQRGPMAKKQVLPYREEIQNT